MDDLFRRGLAKCSSLLCSQCTLGHLYSHKHRRQMSSCNDVTISFKTIFSPENSLFPLFPLAKLRRLIFSHPPSESFMACPVFPLVQGIHTTTRKKLQIQIQKYKICHVFQLLQDIHTTQGLQVFIYNFHRTNLLITLRIAHLLSKITIQLLE